MKPMTGRASLTLEDKMDVQVWVLEALLHVNVLVLYITSFSWANAEFFVQHYLQGHLSML
mgnify:CR=1 FL=1